MVAGMPAAAQPLEAWLRPFAARYNAEWPIEKNGYRSPNAARAAWNEQTLRRAA